MLYPPLTPSPLVASLHACAEVNPFQFPSPTLVHADPPTHCAVQAEKDLIACRDRLPGDAACAKLQLRVDAIRERQRKKEQVRDAEEGGGARWGGRCYC